MTASAHIHLKDSRTKWVKASLGDASLDLHYSNSTKQSIPFYRILFVQALNNASVEISFVARKYKKSLKLKHIRGSIQDPSQPIDRWVESVMEKVYDDKKLKRSPSLLVLINPYGGVAKGPTLYDQLVAPLFKAAKCKVEVIYTNRRHHAYEIAQTMSLTYDTVVSVSGDGLIHEIFNGFAHHDQSISAFATPVVPIPTGSGNGLSMNLLGPQDGFDIVAAALNAVKGVSMAVDIFSFVQDDKRTFSFMSQALGLMADLDLGTENLRWMGDTRFLYGLFRGIAQFKSCPVQLSYKPAFRDKREMYETHKSSQSSTSLSQAREPYPELPPLNFPTDDDSEEWTVVEEPLLYVYAGKGPYVGRDLMMFPVSLPDDGLIDIAAQPLSSRSDVLAGFPNSEKGAAFWQPSLHYIKAHAYRVKPLSEKGFLSIDGESFPFKEFQVEAHQALATVRSPNGRYAADFSLTPRN